VPGTVIGRLTSFDQTGDFAFDVPVKDPLAGMMRVEGSYPWRADNGTTTVVHLKNTTNQRVEAIVQVRYDGGTYNPERVPLAPYQTVALDIGQMRDAQVPDIRGGVMPRELDAGQVVWFEMTPGSLIGRAEVANIGLGVASSFSCAGSCSCSPSFQSSSMSPSSIAGTIGTAGLLNVYETDVDCGGVNYGPYNRNNISTWGTTNSSVATISGGSYTLVGAGTATITASFLATVYNQGQGCQPTTVNPGTGSGVTAITVTLDPLPAVGEGQSGNVKVTLTPSPVQSNVTLTISTADQTSGSAQFASTSSTTLNISQKSTVTINGVSHSSTAGNMTLQASLGGQSLASEAFTVVLVTLHLRNGSDGGYLNDDAGGTNYLLQMGTSALGTFQSNGQAAHLWRTGVEVSGTVQPSNYTGMITLRRQVDANRTYNGSTLTSNVGNCGQPTCPDTSDSTLRDDDPQSGGSGGVVYDLDAPAFGSTSSAAVGAILRARTNYHQWATDATNSNLRFSADFQWFSRISIMKTASGDVLQNDVTGDNTAGTGTTALSWNLQ
jgi:hypothetical protein